jgi:alpha-tubulin suppressor-like RCC1 family protein
LGVLGFGLLAVFSLVWQQQATLASFVDAENGTGTFTAATLAAITPKLTARYSGIDASWSAASGDWATPQYTLNSSDDGGVTSDLLYSGTGTSATDGTGTNTPRAYGLNFTTVSAGATHACGISQGVLYCWGYASGGLGIGSTSATVPTAVTALKSMTTTEVSAGTNFTCAVADGAAYCWGLGTNGQLGNGTSTSATPLAVSGLSGKKITSISAGGTHACAVADATAYCWGYNLYGQLGDGTATQRSVATAVDNSGLLSGRRVKSISAGTYHTCAVADGKAFCWGRGSSGRLGNGLVGVAYSPVDVYVGDVLMGRTVTAISAGYSHSCAIADGAAFCWGSGGSGRLGNSASTTSYYPVQVTTTVMSGTVTAIAAGRTDSCAIGDGAAYCWGSGTSYALGNSSTNNASAPIAVTASGVLKGRSLTSISVGTSFACTAGVSPAACWGLGVNNQMGDGSTTSNLVPGDVTLNGQACADGSVRTGDSTCSLTQGTDHAYRLGYSIGTWNAPISNWVAATTKTRPGLTPSVSGRTSSSITLGWDPSSLETGKAYPEYTVERSASSSGSDPVTVAVTGDETATDYGSVAPSADFSQVSAGYAHSCGILDDQLYCWGSNTNGQLGLGTTTNASRPTLVAALAGKTVSQVSAGYNYTCAIADSKVYCWGYNDYGKLGDGTGIQRTTPTLVSNQTGVVATGISAGTSHTCAIFNGAAFCWGGNVYYALGTGNATSSSVPVAVTSTGVLSGKTVTAVTTGNFSSCAIAAGMAYCWGNNDYGKLGDGTTTTRSVPVAATISGKTVTSISAGYQHTCAVAGGAAYCWGYGADGEIGNGSTTVTTSRPTAVKTTMDGTVTAISSGYMFSCAMASGSSYCWGYNANGRLGTGTTTAVSVPTAVLADGGLSGATTSAIAAGWHHSCAIINGAPYCWGYGDSYRLGNDETADVYYPTAASIGGLRCGSGVAFGDGGCTLSAGTTYYYRVTFTLDGNTTTVGDWTGLTTAS